MKLILTFAIACGVILVLSCKKGTSYKEPHFDGTNYVIDISMLQESQPEFYAPSINNKRVCFFLIRVHGEVQSYFNACRECYPKKLGFYLDNGYIACKSCNVKYPVEALKDGMGSCYPIRLKGSVIDNRYIITRDAMMAGVKYF